MGALCAIEFGFGQISPLASDSAGPRAKTRDELDRVGLVYEASEAAETIAQAETFAKDYPNSEFLEFVVLMEMDAHLELGDSEAARKAAEAVLQIRHDNVHALISLADIYAGQHDEGGERSAKTRQLAEQHVHRALSLLDNLAMPRGAQSRAWLRAKKELLAHAYSVLGYLLLKANDLDGALTNLTTAAQLDPLGIYFYRCGLAYSRAGKRQKAVEAFQEARRLGPKEVTEFSERRLQEMARQRQPAKIPQTVEPSKLLHKILWHGFVNLKMSAATLCRCPSTRYQ